MIDHTPKNEKVLIKLGSAFDVVGERRQVDFRIDTSRKTMTEDIEIKLRNQKTGARHRDRQGKPLPLDQLADHRRKRTTSKNRMRAPSTSR